MAPPALRGEWRPTDMAPMRIAVGDRPVAGSTVVTLHGDLDIDSALPLHATLGALVDRSSIRLVIDLGPVTFCDSTSLSAFADADRRCRDQDGYLRLAAPSPFLHRILTVVGLATRIPIYATVYAACVDDTAQLVPPAC